MTLLPNPLRPAILAAARSPRLERAITHAPGTRNLVKRFIAGSTRAEAAVAVSRLLDDGRAVSIDFLGEHTTDRAAADATVEEYLALIAELGEMTAARRGPVAAEVSVKLSALGQALPVDGARIATDNAARICAAAATHGVWVTVDMEDHTTTDATLQTVRELRGDFSWVGAVLQSYLRRTEADCADLAGPGSRIRLCKGAYREPESVAYQSRDDVDASYRRCLAVLMRGRGYPMVASHDPAMIDETKRLVRETRRSPTDFEHQMLYGIRDLEQVRLAQAGNTMRVYVPYGSQWYGYFMRRLAERPANVRFFLRSVATES